MCVVISGFLLPRYYHTITTPNRFMMLPASSNRRSNPCLQPSGKVIPTIRQTYPKLCPTLPKALGTCARNYRLIVLIFSGIGAHVHGHKSSCTWAQVHLLPFTIYVDTFFQPVNWKSRHYRCCKNKHNRAFLMNYTMKTSFYSPSECYFYEICLFFEEKTLFLHLN